MIVIHEVPKTINTRQLIGFTGGVRIYNCIFDNSLTPVGRLRGFVIEHIGFHRVTKKNLARNRCAYFRPFLIFLRTLWSIVTPVTDKLPEAAAHPL